MADNHMEPCPFCGSFAIFEPRTDCAIIRCSRRNDGCPVNMRTHTNFKTFSEAQQAWNTRSNLADKARKEGYETGLREAADEIRDWQAFTLYGRERISEEMAQAVLALITKEQAND